MNKLNNATKTSLIKMLKNESDQHDTALQNNLKISAKIHSYGFKTILDVIETIYGYDVMNKLYNEYKK